MVSFERESRWIRVNGILRKSLPESDSRPTSDPGAICRGQGVERQIAIHQLANKDIKSHSWFVRTGITLAKYALPDAHSLSEDPSSKSAWRNTCQNSS